MVKFTCLKCEQVKTYPDEMSFLLFLSLRMKVCYVCCNTLSNGSSKDRAELGARLKEVTW